MWGPNSLVNGLRILGVQNADGKYIRDLVCRV